VDRGSEAQIVGKGRTIDQIDKISQDAIDIPHPNVLQQLCNSKQRKTATRLASTMIS
jgi:hypothetical protein